MTKQFNVMDLWSIQDCLNSYRVLLEWLPATSEEEEDLRDDRLKTIEHLMIKCEDILDEDEENNR